MTIENPWQTTEGALARQNLFRRMAVGEGPLADFAKDVLSGDRQPRDLLTYSPVTETITTRLAACARLWHALDAQTRESLIGQGQEILHDHVAALAQVEPDESAPETEQPG